MKLLHCFTAVTSLLPLNARSACSRQTPSLPDARPRSDRFRCGGRVSRFLAAILLLGTCAMQVSAAEPSKVATERAGKLKADLKSFTLSLNFNGQQDKPYYHLLLSVPKPPGDDRANPFYQNVQVTEKQAQAIIDYLAIEGFFDRAQEAFYRTPVPPYYKMWVEVRGDGRAVRYGEFLGWNLKMIQRLDGLRKVLEGDAAKAMDILIARMAGHRTEWEKQEK